MVYCGKPSLGCYDCRQRKTRCDKIPLPQGCTQCMKAKRKCTGYRALGEAIFRDESNSVIQKIKAKEAREKNSNGYSTNPTPISSNSEEDTTGTGSEEFFALDIVSRNHTECQPNPYHTLVPTIQEQAVGFFVANYVLSLRGPSLGHLDCIPELYKTQNVGQCLDASIAAVGLASFSHAANAPILMQSARRQYLKAIQLTNQALKSPEDVKSDSTLMSIMVLSIFEAVTGTKQGSLKSWAEHVQGATAVINLRGPQGVRTVAGRRMLFQVTSSLLTHCLYRGVPLPDFMCELIDEAVNTIANPNPPIFIQKTMIAYASLNASIVDGSCFEPKVIIARALELEGALLERFTNLPRGWEYETVFTDVECDMIYKGQYHIYYDYWVAQMWNLMRIARILLNSTIRDALLKGFSAKPPLFSEPEYTAQFQISTDVLYELQRDILSSIPQHLGLISSNSVPFQRNNSLESEISISPHNWGQFSNFFDDSEPLRMSGGYFLLWPLWFAGIMDISDEPIRQFVIKNLKSVGRNMGIQQAFVLAATIERGTGIQVW